MNLAMTNDKSCKKGHPLQEYGLGTNWLWGCFSEKDLGALVGSTLEVSQEDVLTAVKGGGPGAAPAGAWPGTSESRDVYHLALSRPFL